MLIINIKDPKDLIRIIKKIESDKDYFKNMVEKSKIYIDSKLNEKKLLENFDNIFNDYYNYYTRYN